MEKKVCYCEHIDHEMDSHAFFPKNDNHAWNHKAQLVGQICDDCAETHMKEYLLVKDPRKVGQTWHSGYWRKDYTILEMWKVHGVQWFTVKWAGGSNSTHCTAFDERDKLVDHDA